MDAHLQLEGVLFAGKHVRKGVHLAVKEREILGRDVRELDEHHGGWGVFGAG